jgi:hypothetical protein
MPGTTSKKMTKRAITREEAERSADDVMPMLREWFVGAIMDGSQHRDVGKVLAYAVESHVNKWIASQCGRPIETVIGKPYDGVTSDDRPTVRNQVKFRMNAWHFETTRRNSKKNKETNSTGHVAYRTDEFDMVAIFTPGPTFGIEGSTIRCIPVSALVHPTKPGQLITTIGSAIRKEYDNNERTLEVIRQMYLQTPSSPRE